MSELVAYYDENPIEVKGEVEIHQSPMSAAAGSRSLEGVIRAALVYVRVPSAAGLLVPFGKYDDWSLRSRYNEALRIMNTLGAAEINCEALGERTVRRGLRAKIPGRGAELTQQRVENSEFDYRPCWRGQRSRRPEATPLADEPDSRPQYRAFSRTGRVRWSSTSEPIALTRSMAPWASSSTSSASTLAGQQSIRPRPGCTSSPASRRPARAGGFDRPALVLR